ncbi:MAG: aminopeptidase [Pseudomonadales bacterium]
MIESSCMRDCKLLNLLALLLIVTCLAGCEALGFYTQAIGGQLHLLRHRESVEKILEDSQQPPALQQRLALIEKMLDFAEQDLQLPVEKSYSSYVKLNQDFIVWNVFATERFSVEPVEWCYPIAGCASYRGYFKQTDAEKFAAKMENKGYDVYVGGVKAYSTLGWFNDPLLDTFVNFSEDRLAALLFHELAHKVLYVKDDTEFNESFASAVEQIGVQRWFERHGQPQQFARYQQRLEERAAFHGQVALLRDSLQSLYESSAEEGLLQAGREKLYTEFTREFVQFQQHWQTADRYALWLGRGDNNAKLLPVVAYNRWVPAFTQLVEENEFKLSDFYAECQQLAKQKKQQREDFLAKKALQ